MEERKNKNGLIVFLALLVIILASLCILLATGTLSFKDDVDNCTTPNNTVDSALLNYLYDILGINWEYQSSGDCLNKFLSNSNYTDINYKDNPSDYSSNAKRIFSLYASHNYMNTYRYDQYNCGELCKHAYSCAECTSILKTNAEKIKKIYSLDGLKMEELDGVETDYAYTTGVAVGVCHYGVTHDLTSEYVDANSIRITDKQVVTDYVFAEDGKINSVKNQTVIYNFKKDSEGNYYIGSVEVK